jgi:uncharacterized protein
MWQRRAFLKSAGTAFAAALLPRQVEALDTAELVFATATQESPDRFGARLLTETGRLIAAIDLPMRGHDVAFSPSAGRAIVFARRPGTLAVVFDPSGREGPVTIASPADRHFFGHGAFSADGRLLYAAENDFAANRGVVGIYDVAGGYRRLGEFPAYGIGPHEILLMPDGKTLAIANGGIETHPDYGRAELNLDAMAPSLVFVDTTDGSLVGELRLDAALHQLSIRHLAVDASNRLWFGCQFRGPGDARPQLIGYATPDGDIRLIELPSDALGDLANYVGGLAVSADRETIAVSSPVGGTVLTIDTRSAAPGTRLRFAHTCGVAPDRTGFVAGNGLGQLQGLAGSNQPRRQFDFLFDEHLRSIG